MPQNKYTAVSKDRISRLPDDVISKILSCLPTIDAVGTCVLSKAWENKWKSIHTIDIDAEECEFCWGFEESEDMVKCLVNGVKPLFQHVGNVKAIFFRDESTVISNIDPSELELMISRFLTYKPETLHIDLGQKEASEEMLENDKIRCENIAIREALKNMICPSYGAPPVNEDSYFDEQKLQIDNMHLKEELDRVSSIAAKYIGRPISQLPPVKPIHVSSLDLSMASFAPQGMHHGTSLDFDLLSGSSSCLVPNLAFPNMSISDMDKSVMVDIATNAMDEVLKLLQTEKPLWIKSNDGRLY